MPSEPRIQIRTLIPDFPARDSDVGQASRVAPEAQRASFDAKNGANLCVGEDIVRVNRCYS